MRLPGQNADGQAAQVQVNADTINVLLPNIVGGLSSNASKDFQMATHMVLAQLCSHAVLSAHLLKGQTVHPNSPVSATIHS